MEEWKDIEGYEGIYQISNKGNLRSCEREIDYLVKGKYKAKRVFPSIELKKYMNNNGYFMVDLHLNGKRDKCSVHRLVAEAFILNPNNLPCVDHINTIRDDNRVENLKWCTYEENNNNPITKEKHKGKIITAESRMKMSESQKKRFETEEPWMKGKSHSEEVKEKISNKNSKKIYQYTLDNELVGVYKNSVIASKETSFPQAQINKYAHGKYYSKLRGKWYYKNTYKGYKWSFEPL